MASVSTQNDRPPSSSVSGCAVFTGNISPTQQQEAVAPLITSDSPAYLLWFDNVAGFATGVALVNGYGSQANIPVIIRDDTGTIISTKNISLPPQGHTSFDLASTYQEAGNLRGTLEFDAPAGDQISVLGLRFNPQMAFSSIPAIAKSVPTGGSAVGSPALRSRPNNSQRDRSRSGAKTEQRAKLND